MLSFGPSLNTQFFEITPAADHKTLLQLPVTIQSIRFSFSPALFMDYTISYFIYNTHKFCNI